MNRDDGGERKGVCGQAHDIEGDVGGRPQRHLNRRVAGRPLGIVGLEHGARRHQAAGRVDVEVANNCRCTVSRSLVTLRSALRLSTLPTRVVGSAATITRRDTPIPAATDDAATAP